MTQLDYDYEGELDLDALLAVAITVPLTGTDLRTLASAVPTLVRRLRAAENQVFQVKRVVKALQEADGSFHGPTADEIRRSTGDWVEAALEGRLDPHDPKKGLPRVSES